MRATGLRPSRRREWVLQSAAALLPPPTALDQPGAGARHRTVFSWISWLYIRGRNVLRLPNWTPIEPNLNLPIIRSATLAFMMFNQDASGTDKDLLRPSLRSRVSAFGAALKPQKRDVIVPSAPQSECSTLVDFAIEDVLLKEDAAVEFETEDYMLDADNSAWGNGKFSAPSSPKKQKAARAARTVSFSQTHVLDSENTAWATARPTVTQPVTKSRSRFFGSSRLAIVASGVEPQYLDPEDRAWM